MKPKKEKINHDELFAWEAPTRPFKKRDRTFFQTVISLAFLLVVISLFLREWLLIPPPVMSNKITTKGIWVGDTFFKFSEILQYWFEKQLENTVLVLLTQFGTEVNVVIPTDKKEEIDTVLRDRLVFREKPLKNFIEKIGDWLRKSVPLEETSHSQNTKHTS
ncbi:MAG: hypothetical protein UU41_C0020G0021 [Candidatus Roizmanbacteria bacterium GW2011_GWA1_41_13]|uniref:DUF5673 domain-containing protein n=1 Tax=Candidatus Roizmanbacteria bacterium GW2011_GWA1_41_13 TaxID=1618474 RepID=A0A0G0V0M7_9BACT|nr:MAG: hypothetical protein UU41_C0020G0021 [Candidatus Roizmanbacteria bacterium GW2011_GWA1_41_13]